MRERVGGAFLFIYLFIKDFIYLFDRERNSQRERKHKQGGWERRKQAPSGVGRLMRGSIPGPRDHALSQGQTRNDRATQEPLGGHF